MLAPLVIVIQLTELTAVQAQLEPVITVMLPILPVDGTETVVGDTEYEHCACAGRASRTRANTSRTPNRHVIDRPSARSQHAASASQATNRQPRCRCEGNALVCGA
jgi:hypothetical protein